MAVTNYILIFLIWEDFPAISAYVDAATIICFI
jgi:hypothetical protein